MTGNDQFLVSMLFFYVPMLVLFQYISLLYGFVHNIIARNMKITVILWLLNYFMSVYINPSQVFV